MCGDLRHASAPIIAEDAKQTQVASARLILDRWASLTVARFVARAG